MGNSLGDFNIEKSSSADVKNIKWTKKNSPDTKKSKKEKKAVKNTSPTNIIYAQKSKPSIEKIFKIEEEVDTEKSKKKNAGKSHQKASASNCNIKQGFKRPGR